MARPQSLGEAGEALAACYLRLLGCHVDATRVRLAGVEVDLIARDGDATVLVEVRVRSRSDFGAAAETLDHRKQERLRRAALALRVSGPVRIDVIAVDLEPEGLRLRRIRNAIAGDRNLG